MTVALGVELVNFITRVVVLGFKSTHGVIAGLISPQRKPNFPPNTAHKNHPMMNTPRSARAAQLTPRTVEWIPAVRWATAA